MPFSNAFVNGFLVPAGVVLRRHENQSVSCFRGRLWLRGSATHFKNADHGHVRGEDANPNGHSYRNAENQRHEKRNHGSTTLSKLLKIKCSIQMPPAQLSSTRHLQIYLGERSRLVTTQMRRSQPRRSKIRSRAVQFLLSNKSVDLSTLRKGNPPRLHGDYKDFGARGAPA
jgi:hypothetical protein